MRKQDFKKIEEISKNYLKERSEKLVEKQEKSLQELLDMQKRDIVRTMLFNLKIVISSWAPYGSNLTPSIRSVKEIGSNKAMRPKLTLLQLPKFNGGRLNEWTYRCENYFEYNETPSETKVKIEAIHIKGKALRWHQNYMRNQLKRDMLDWDEYIVRFGSDLHVDPMVELKNHKQIEN